jgi:hypothetical protein
MQAEGGQKMAGCAQPAPWDEVLEGIEWVRTTSLLCAPVGPRNEVFEQQRSKLSGGIISILHDPSNIGE